MVNHIQTLLLNESAAVVEENLDQSDYGYVDPGFMSLSLDKNITKIYGEMFPDGDLDDKFHRVKAYLPYTMAPEFESFRTLFDTRVTSVYSPPNTVFDFYGSMTDETFYPVMSYVRSVNAPMAFLPSGDGELDQHLQSLQSIYSSCKESAKRFSALLYAVVIHLQAAYLRFSR